MLQLSGFGNVSDDFMECMGSGGDLDVCRALHRACLCNPNTEWCDDAGRCVPFTAAEQAEWAASSKPPNVVATSPKPSLISGISNKTLAIGAGLAALAALLLLRR